MTASPAKPPALRVVGHSDVRLWALDGAERLRRQARAIGLPLDGPGAPAADAVILARADHLFEERTLRDLAAHPGTLLLANDGACAPVAAAAHVPAAQAAAAQAVLEGAAPPAHLAGVETTTAATLSPAYLGALLKSAPPRVLAVRPDDVATLERLLFAGSYKGVTDLVTKWVWPTPARWVTGWCARHGVRPNTVTAVSLLLVLAAIALFAGGHFALGLFAAWVMTFLDTVDGKLARVTVTSSRFGHLFDHVIDVVHPPLWYLAWAWGVAGDAAGLWGLAPDLVAILAAYVLGRLLEGAFEWGLAGFSIFTWRPLDSYGRLITARRNPNLLLLTAGALLGLHRAALAAVAGWTVLSTVVLALRLAQAAWVRARGGTLRPWLAALADAPAPLPAWARPFATDPARATPPAR